MPSKFCVLLTIVLTVAFAAVAGEAVANIVHDAEFYILEVQNGERWAEQDKEIDKKLADLRKKHGAPPNIVYILWDDAAFGSAGFPGLPCWPC